MPGTKPPVYFICKKQLIWRRDPELDLPLLHAPPGLSNIQRVVPGSISRMSSCDWPRVGEDGRIQTVTILFYCLQSRLIDDRIGMNFDRHKDYSVCILNGIYFIQDLLQIFLNFNEKKKGKKGEKSSMCTYYCCKLEVYFLSGFLKF